MNKHLDKYLCKKYPKIFANRHKPMNETCMCWGFECGNGWFFLLDQLCSSIQNHIDEPQYVEPKTLEVRIKKLWNRFIWNPILYPLGHRYYKPKLDDKNSWEKWRAFQNRWNFQWDWVPGPTLPQLVADQVKEKFGGLRFYYHGGDEHIRSIIHFAESLSCSICEDCGRTDELVARGGKSWVRTTCPCHSKDSEFHKKIVDKNMVKLWEKVRKEESKKTPKSQLADAFRTVKEVEKYKSSN